MISVDEWASLIATMVCNDIVEHHPETSDAVLGTVSESIATTLNHFWEKRPDSRIAELLRRDLQLQLEIDKLKADAVRQPQ